MELSEEKQFAISHLHIRRKSTQLTAGILLAVLLAVALIFVGVGAFNDIEASMARDIAVIGSAETSAPAISADALHSTSQAVSAARTRLLVIGALIFVIVTFVAYRALTVGPRVVAQEFWIRRMGEGDLDYKPDLGGNDEIAESAAALEKLRQRSIRVVRLNLVERLSQDLQAKNDELEGVLAELRRTQDQIVQQQKLAELGELTAGVAHEIRNPLNFIKNFSEASSELLQELDETVAENADRLSDESRELIGEISRDLADNTARILSHGARADRIIRDMLRLGRGSVEFQSVDINDLLRERAMLAYRSARSAEPDFPLDIREELDPNAGEAAIVPEDMARVFLNIVGNACYATAEKRNILSAIWQPFLHAHAMAADEAKRRLHRDTGAGQRRRYPARCDGKDFQPVLHHQANGQGHRGWG